MIIVHYYIRMINLTHQRVGQKEFHPCNWVSVKVSTTLWLGWVHAQKQPQRVEYVDKFTYLLTVDIQAVVVKRYWIPSILIIMLI